MKVKVNNFVLVSLLLTLNKFQTLFSNVFIVDFERVNASCDYATNQNPSNRDLVLKTRQNL